eukprot:m.186396 g.186396  ORF g.186396 m.186396 type:complete len:96 (+) comp15050_c0_seq4:916-1203(+)
MAVHCSTADQAELLTMIFENESLAEMLKFRQFDKARRDIVTDDVIQSIEKSISKSLKRATIESEIAVPQKPEHAAEGGTPVTITDTTENPRGSRE